MTDHSEVQRPSEQFRAALEVRVSQELRRVAGAASSNSRKRLMFTGSLAASLAIGVVIGAAPAQIQDARQRDSLTSAAQRELQIVTSRLQIMEEAYRTASIRFQLGMLSFSEFDAANAALTAALSGPAIVRLNLEEIQAASMPPRNDLSAPLVGQRDFVKERLQVRLSAAQNTLARAELDSSLTERRVQTGMLLPPALDEARLVVTRAKAEVEILMETLVLRQRFLRERIAPVAIDKLQQFLEARQELTVALQLVAVAALRLRNLKEQEKVGTVERAELLKAELEVLQRTADVQAIKKKVVELTGGRGGAD